MDCGKIRKELHAYLAEVVTDEEKAEIEGHLVTCTDCKMALEELKQTVRLLENLDEVEPPAWLTQRVMARVRAENAVKEGFFTRLFGWIPANLPATAVATLVIAVTAVVLIKGMEPRIQETIQTTVTEQPLAPIQREVPQQTAPENRDKSGARVLDHAARGEAPGPQASLQDSLPTSQTIPDARPAAAPPIATSLAPAKKNLPERNFGTVQKKTTPTRESLTEDRTTASQENKTLSHRQALATLSAAPTAPAVSSTPKPAAALPEYSTARGRPISKDASQTEQGRPPEKAKEERASGSLLQQQERMITERYAGGRPQVVITYQNTAGKSGKVMEERFDEQGRHHGLHRSYDIAGNLTAEVLYEHGEPVSIKEFNADGTLRAGFSNRDWPWLKPDLR